MAETTRTCPGCNKDLSNFPSDIRNCPYCGTKLEIVPPPYDDRYPWSKDWQPPKPFRPKPSSAWYLVPLFFGIIGGLIGYVAVKDEDRDMAVNLLAFGIIMTFINIIVIWAIYSYYISMLTRL